MNYDGVSVCLVTVDGTDFKIYEPSPFDEKWYSQKWNHAGLRYEIGICIQTGWIVWINGPYPPGDWPDLNISRDGLNQALMPWEKFLADGGYADGNGWSYTPTGYNTREQYMKAVARARHETINSLFKKFNALKNEWRHHRSKHGLAFGAIANITQAQIQLETATFQVKYHDRLARYLHH
jgi:hypothetical protein